MSRRLLTALFSLFTLRSAAAADFATEMMNATFKFNDGGTCFLVRREAPDPAVYLVTARHGLGEFDTAVIALRKAMPDGTYERHNWTIAVRRDKKPLWTQDEKHDVAVIRLTEPLPVSVAALPISALAGEARLKDFGVHLCSPLFVLGFPLGLEATESGLPVARTGIFASPPLQPLQKNPSFLADYNASGGDSGGPVFIATADNHPLVVGIVTEQHYFEDELKGTFQEIRIRNPLGVAKILHAQYVRDTIETASQKVEASPKVSGE